MGSPLPEDWSVVPKTYCQVSWEQKDMFYFVSSFGVYKALVAGGVSCGRALS